MSSLGKVVFLSMSDTNSSYLQIKIDMQIDSLLIMYITIHPNAF